MITGAHDLPNEYVIHYLGPVYGRDEPADELLARCHRCAISFAAQHGVTSIAFPALSTGAFGFPIEEAAPIALDAVANALAETEEKMLIRFVLFSEKDLSVFREVYEAMEHEWLTFDMETIVV